MQQKLECKSYSSNNKKKKNHIQSESYKMRTHRNNNEITLKASAIQCRTAKLLFEQWKKKTIVWNQ